MKSAVTRLLRLLGLLGLTLLMAALAVNPASARDSKFTRGGVGPLYWSTYEYQYSRNSPMDESEWRRNIDWIAADLKNYGYDMVVTDGWIEGAQLTNKNGYILKHNDGWKHDWAYWARYAADKGLKLGVYYNPLWVTRSAANDQTKTIVGTNYKVKDIANSSDTFNDDLYWVDVTKPGAKEYIQGYVRYFKDMGVPYLRIDFLSWYENGVDKGKRIGIDHGADNYRTALRWMKEAAGDEMELSLVMPHLFNQAASEMPYGDMVRINEDLATGGWENLSGQRQTWRNGWSQWANPFLGFTGFSDIAGKGSGMIMDGDFIRMNTFANDDERKTAINLYTMAGSPIAITDQHSTIGRYDRFYKNRRMLELHKQGFVGKPYYHNGNPYSQDFGARDSEKWLGQLPDGSWIVGLFNRSDARAVRSVDYKRDLGLEGKAVTTEMWNGRKLGSLSAYKPSLRAHASEVLRIEPRGDRIRYQTEVAAWAGGAHFNNNHKGYSGFGFTDRLSTAGAKVVISVRVPKDGAYPIAYRYGNATGQTSTMRVVATDRNGSAVGSGKTVSFPNAPLWNNWRTRTGTIQLKAGENLITIERTANDKGAINLDYIELDTSPSAG